MDNNMISHLVFSVIAIFFFILCNQAKKSEHAVSFFNVLKAIEDYELTDVKAYNLSIGNVYFIYGVFMAAVSFVNVSQHQLLAIILICIGTALLVLGNVIILKKYKKH